MEIKTTMRYYFTPVRGTKLKHPSIVLGEDVEQRGLLHTANENAKWPTTFKNSLAISKKAKYILTI